MPVINVDIFHLYFVCLLVRILYAIFVEKNYLLTASICEQLNGIHFHARLFTDAKTKRARPFNRSKLGVPLSGNLIYAYDKNYKLNRTKKEKNKTTTQQKNPPTCVTHTKSGQWQRVRKFETQAKRGEKNNIA